MSASRKKPVSGWRTPNFQSSRSPTALVFAIPAISTGSSSDRPASLREPIGRTSRPHVRRSPRRPLRRGRDFNRFILRDAAKRPLLRMRSLTLCEVSDLMVRSASSRVSNHGHGGSGNGSDEPENDLDRKSALPPLHRDPFELGHFFH